MVVGLSKQSLEVLEHEYQEFKKENPSPIGSFSVLQCSLANDEQEEQQKGLLKLEELPWNKGNTPASPKEIF